jgi:hypothetical protein
MMRKLIVVGDPPAPGGAVLPYSGPMMDVFGHRIALIGGRAYCEGCNSVGIIAKAGGPRRGEFYGAEMALEGDVVICHCPVPPPLVATLVHNTEFDDMLAGTREFNASYTALPGWFAGDSPSIAASKKVVDEMVEHPPEAEQTENICPNMTNKEFATLAMKLRDMAIDYISKKRLPELERWDKEAQVRAKTWFGVADPSLREHLQRGLAACVRVLQGLEAKNFVRFTAGGKLVSCVLDNGFGTVAAVCKPDIATHTIAIALPFCGHKENLVNYDTGETVDGDSQLLVLIHEVTHFDDTFSSNDTWYGTINSKRQVRSEDQAALRLNADSLAAYILGIT